MTYGTIPRARGIAVGDPAVIILTGEPVKILRIEARDVRREVRVYFEVSAAGELPLGGRWVPAALVRKEN